MPKVELNESLTVTASDIEVEIAKCNYLLNGRLDVDNVGVTSIHKEYISDIALEDRPVDSLKFLSNTTAEDSAGTTPKKMLDRFSDALDDNPEYILLTGEGLLAYTEDTLAIEGTVITIPKPANYRIEKHSNGDLKVWVDMKVDYDLTTTNVFNNITPNTLFYVSDVSEGDDSLTVKIDKDIFRDLGGAVVDLSANEFVNGFFYVTALAGRIR